MKNYTDAEILEKARYVLAHPWEKFDPDLLRLLFPKPAVMDNFGIRFDGEQEDEPEVGDD